MKINEGLNVGDLENNIEPLISIDEFEPKTGTSAEVIVLSFYLLEDNAAADFANFIEKGVIPNIDSEVSPNPDEDGFFNVFIEFHRDENFFQHLDDLVRDVETITDKKDWQVKTYLSDDIFELTDVNFKKYVQTDKDNYLTKDEYLGNMNAEENELMAEELMGYFKDTSMSNFTFENNSVTIDTISLDFIDYGDYNKLNESYNLAVLPFNLKDRMFINEIQKSLGDNWSVAYLKEYIVINQSGSDKALILSK